MLKAAGACLVVAAAAGIGVSFSADLKKRCSELRMLKQMIYMLRGEIKYTKTPLPEAFSHIAVRLPEPFSLFLNGTAERMRRMEGETLGEIWRDQIKKDLAASHLSRQDKEQLATLGEILGYLDLEMQLSAVDLYLEQLESGIRQAQEDAGEKRKLYQTLGVAGGIFLVILLL